MFVTSVIYHWASHPELKQLLRKLDHSAIYLLIAGTYTPFTLVARMRNPGAGRCSAWCGRWRSFGCRREAHSRASVIRASRLSLYLGMGWLIVIAINPLREA